MSEKITILKKSNFENISFPPPPFEFGTKSPKKFRIVHYLRVARKISQFRKKKRVLVISYFG